MANFKSADDFKNWLDGLPEGQRPAAARILAMRTAFRVFPLLLDGSVKEKNYLVYSKSGIKTILTAFRSMSISIASIYYQKNSELNENYILSQKTRMNINEFRLNRIRNLSATNALVSAYCSSDNFYNDNSVMASDLALSVVSASIFAVANYYKAYLEKLVPGYFGILEGLSLDAIFLETGASARSLAMRRIWLQGPPKWAQQITHEFNTKLERLGDDWDVWTRWYQARLNGAPVDEVLELRRAMIPNEDWEKGPAHVNALIKRLEQDRARELAEQAAPKAPASQFFISYSTSDEAKARDIVRILEEAGHSTFAMYKDIPAGANFVSEMQSALAATLANNGRVVALYSPAYVASNHCQAEWSTAYNADPSGAKRTLLPFLITPTELPPLARQVVFKSLVGLDRAEIKAAVLATIAPKPAKPTPQQIKQTLASVATPQPVLDEDGRIDIKPNTSIDLPVSTRDLANLPGDQRVLVGLVLQSLPPNTPPMIRNGLKRYGRVLSERGLGLRPAPLTVIIVGIEKEFRASGLEFWGSGLEHWFETIFANHELIRTHFPLKDEQEYAELPIDENKAMGEALTGPIETVLDTVRLMNEEKLVSERTGQMFEDNAQTATDIAHLPPDEIASQPGSTRVSIKRRYVLTTLGMMIGFYNFVGSTASIISTPAGAQFFKALGEAIEMLMKLLL